MSCRASRNRNQFEMNNPELFAIGESGPYIHSISADPNGRFWPKADPNFARLLMI